MKLFSLTFLILFLTQLTSGFICSFCPDGGLGENTNYIYVNSTPCFEFGDCIDKGQDDNTFWLSQLDAYLRQSVVHLTSYFKTVERKIYHQRDNGNLTIFDGSPQVMCMPSHELSQNAAFLRKMHSAYRLSELARKCKIMTMDLVAQVIARLQIIAESLDVKKSLDLDSLNAVCDLRIDEDRRDRQCQRINDRAPTEYLYIDQLKPAVLQNDTSDYFLVE